jgi:hypothetical protein
MEQWIQEKSVMMGII